MASIRGYVGSKLSKGAPKRQKAPFGPSLGPLGTRRPCLATLLRAYSPRSHSTQRGNR